MFSAYRLADFTDPDGFVAQLGGVLAEFPREVVDYVTCWKTGIQRRSKWPPTISEVLTACEVHQDFLAAQAQPRRLNAPAAVYVPLNARPQGYMAQVFVPEGHDRYHALCKRAESSAPIWWKYGKASDGRNGIWVSHNFWNNRPDVEGGTR